MDVCSLSSYSKSPINVHGSLSKAHFYRSCNRGLVLRTLKQQQTRRTAQIVWNDEVHLQHACWNRGFVYDAPARA